MHIINSKFAGGLTIEDTDRIEEILPEFCQLFTRNLGMIFWDDEADHDENMLLEAIISGRSGTEHGIAKMCEEHMLDDYTLNHGETEVEFDLSADRSEAVINIVTITAIVDSENPYPNPEDQLLISANTVLVISKRDISFD